MSTNKILVVFAYCVAFGSLAFAQGKPADKAAAAAPTAAPKPMEHMAKPGSPAVPSAGTAAMPEVPKPPPELDAAFKFFDGAWKCDSKFPAGAMGPGSPEVAVKASVRFKKVMRGFYYQGDYDLKKTKTTPAFKGTFMISYQPAAKVFVITSADDTGGAEYAVSPGFQGDNIIFTGEGYMMGQKVKIRETMSKKGDKLAGHKVEVDLGKGFQPMGEDDCKR